MLQAKTLKAGFRAHLRQCLFTNNYELQPNYAFFPHNFQESNLSSQSFFPQTVPSTKMILAASFKLTTLHQNALELHIF